MFNISCWILLKSEVYVIYFCDCFLAAFVNCEKLAVKQFIEKPMSLNFVDLSTIFCPSLFKETDLSLTQPRPYGIYIFDTFQYLKRLTHSSNSVFGAIESPQKPIFDLFQEALFCALASNTNLVLKLVSIEARQY